MGKFLLHSTDSANPNRIHLTTSSYAEQERFAFWQDVISTFTSPSETTLRDRSKAFDGSLKRVVIGNAAVCDLDFEPIVNTRSARDLRHRPDDDFFISLMAEGIGHVEQSGRSATLTSKDIVVYESSKPFFWEARSRCRIVVTRISRRQMLSRLPNATDLTARVIKAGHPLSSVIGRTMTEFANLNAQLDDQICDRLSNSFIDILTSSIEARLTPVQKQSVAVDDLLRRAKAFLTKNIEDCDLDLHALAEHLAVSQRTIARLFAAEHTTPMRWLWQKRRELAFKLLSDRRIENVSQAAMRCGFSDFSHFSRSFKDAYGTTPTEILRRADISSTSVPKA